MPDFVKLGLARIVLHEVLKISFVGQFQDSGVFPSFKFSSQQLV